MMVVWCAPDGSWGECQRDDLIIFPFDHMTAEEEDAYRAVTEWGSDNAVRSVIHGIHERIEGEQ